MYVQGRSAEGCSSTVLWLSPDADTTGNVPFLFYTHLCFPMFMMNSYYNYLRM